MAKKHRKKAKTSCSVKRIKGQGMRRICRDKKGRIKSNTKVRRKK